MDCRTAVFRLTLSEIEDHSRIAGLLKCVLKYICLAFEKILTDKKRPAFLLGR